MAASTNYLRAFVESVAELPAELERNFRGLRELDEKAYALEQAVEADCLTQLKTAAERQQEAGSSPSKRQKLAAAGAIGDAELAARIEHNMNELIKLSDEKMSAAQQIYDYIDQHIRRLDKDLRTFDVEIATERQKLGLPPLEAAGVGAAAVVAGGERKHKRKDAAAAAPRPLTSEELYRAALAAADANEPTYCYCKRISYGEMIACDNPECPVEWFHFECVGLTPENRPKGKWYCKECKKSLQAAA